MTKRYDFELEMTQPWYDKLEKKLNGLVPKGINNKSKEHLKGLAFFKVEKEKWGKDRPCTKCRLKIIPMGHTRYCTDCTRIADDGTEESIYYGW